MKETNQIDKTNIEHAIEIADRIWWVGCYLEDDPFQCQTYLIENDDQSVLIDPGSLLTFEKTVNKIEEIIPFNKIRYFICHHQDPDITTSLPDINKMIDRDDCLIVSHWRTTALLKHYNLSIPFWCVEKNDWELDLGTRALRFVFTPYMHFPGAFCTFDVESGILFSSDIFGAFTEDWELYAKDESYFESMRPFHEHYMPSSGILLNGLLDIEKLPLKAIAPQHGSIIRKDLIGYMISELKKLDCGLYLLNKDVQDVERLSQINLTLKKILETMAYYSSFADIAERLLDISNRLLPLDTIEFYVQIESDQALHLSPGNRYHGEVVTPPVFCKKLWLYDTKDFEKKSYTTIKEKNGTHLTSEKNLVIPLFFSKSKKVNAIAVFYLNETIDIDEELNQMIARLSIPLAVATEREAVYRKLELMQSKHYEASVRDEQTNLHTRTYMYDTVNRLIDVERRSETGNRIVAIMFEIDNIKNVYDTYGNVAIDSILKDFAKLILYQSRSSDVKVRYSESLLFVFMPETTIESGICFAQRVIQNFKTIKHKSSSNELIKVTASAGIAIHDKEEALKKLIQRADLNLHKAKENGAGQIYADNQKLESVKGE